MLARLMLALAAVALLAAADAAVAVADDDTAEFAIEAFPQPDPATSFIDDFGFARRGHRHQGNDLIGVKMMPVVAIADGTVVRVASGGTAGNYLVIAHEGGWESWYLHLNDDTPGSDDGRIGPAEAVAPGIVAGAEVSAGQLVAYAGDSGNAEGTMPHTHFELHHDGRVVNPYPYLEDAWRRYLATTQIGAAPL